METRILSKGQVTLPSAIREELGLRSGDTLVATVKSGQIVLTPRVPKSSRTKIIQDPLTGLPALDIGTKAPQLTKAKVDKILLDLP
ncbi:MAG: AbrB/MazE/SpoVT family DNA-binding domain-containing protein [Bryobacter sp.]|nr:AbrB/MazE/SpoVT family DNA-binding domain-containing protein [Bryobacter sp.]